MNKKKRYSTSVLLLLVVMTITACSGKQSDSTDNTVVAYKPQYSKYEYTFDKSKEVYSNFYGMFIQGDELYCISSNNSRMDTVNIIGYFDRGTIVRNSSILRQAITEPGQVLQGLNLTSSLYMIKILTKQVRWI